MRRIWILAAGLLAACSSRHYVRSADMEGMEIAAEKMAVVDNFRQHELIRPETAEPEPEADPGGFDVPERMTLEDALVVARKYARDYKAQEEAFYLSALDLSLTRRDELRPVLDGNISWAARDGFAIKFTDSTAIALTATQKLPTGGQLSVTGGVGIATVELDGARNQDSSTFGRLSLTQSLLRGGPRWVAFEGLTQAERDVIYDARAFETFRQTFAIGVARDFYGVVVQKRRLAITKTQVETSEFAYKLAEAQFRLRRGTQRDVFRSERDYRNAQNDLLEAEQNYRTSLDRFKIRLGLPLSVKIDVADEIPDVDEPQLEVASAVRAALHNRLDLRTQREQLEDVKRRVRIARHNFLPDFDLTASAESSAVTNALSEISFFSNQRATVALSLEIPLNRKPERNAYRAALVGYAQATRALQRSEDSIIVDVHTLMRGLRLQRQAIENDEANIETERRNLRKANIDFQAGLASNRDLQEAINNLANAEISILSKYTDYEIARLELYQALGVLFIDKDGRFAE